MVRDTPSHKREESIGKLINLLGHTQNQDQRYNVGFAHHSLAVYTSFLRAFERRQAQFVNHFEVSIKEATPIPDTKSNPKPDEKSEDKTEDKSKELIGETITVNRPIFANTMTLTKWIENFYQESPSINARARDDLIQIGGNAFNVAPIQGFQFGGEDPVPDVDEDDK